jgi:hypothetical protein
MDAVFAPAGNILNGAVYYFGELEDDRGRIEVRDNLVLNADYHIGPAAGYACTFDGTYCSVVVAAPGPPSSSTTTAATRSTPRTLTAENRLQLSAVGGFLSPGCVARLAASMSASDAEEYLRVAARLAARLPLEHAPVDEQIEFCCRLKMDAWPIETRLLRTPPLRRTADVGGDDERTTAAQRLTPPQRAEKRNAARRLRRAELRLARRMATSGASSGSSVVSEYGGGASIDDRDVVAAAAETDSGNDETAI